MAEFKSFDGLHDSFTMNLDSTTATAINDNPRKIIGKVVTITDNYTVGYGADGDEPLGVVETVEYDDGTPNGMVVTVHRACSFENIPTTGTVTAGDYLVGAGDGTVKTSGSSSAPVLTHVIAFGADATANTCTILVV